MEALNYYPVLFVLLFFVLIFIMYKDSVHQSSKSKKQECNINFSNKMNKLMNDKQPVVKEIKLVDALSGDEIIYRGGESLEC